MPLCLEVRGTNSIAVWWLFSLSSFTWVPGTELTPPGLLRSLFTHWAITLAHEYAKLNGSTCPFTLPGQEQSELTVNLLCSFCHLFTYEYGFQTTDWSCLNIPATPTINSAVRANWVRDMSYELHSLHHSLSNPSLPPLSCQLHSVYPNWKNHCILCPFPYPRDVSCILTTFPQANV